MNPIQIGKLRLGVVNEGCIRIEYAGSGLFCDDPTLFATLRTYDFNDFSTADDGGAFTLKTTKFQLIYRYISGVIRPGVLLRSFRSVVLFRLRQVTFDFYHQSESNVRKITNTTSAGRFRRFNGADPSKADITASVNFKYIPDILSFLFEKTFPSCYDTVVDSTGYHVVSN